MAMPQVAGERGVDELLAAVERLPPERLREFAQRFIERHSQDHELHPGDDALVQATRTRMPAAGARRLRRLTAKSEEGALDPEEATEYRALAERAEAVDVIRAEALAELVRRRGKPVDSVMQEIAWESGSDGG